MASNSAGSRESGSTVPEVAPRKRVGVACDSCHASKKKCDGNRPCAHCKRAYRTCTYERGPLNKVRLGYVLNLERKLAVMERKLAGAGETVETEDELNHRKSKVRRVEQDPLEPSAEDLGDPTRTLQHEQQDASLISNDGGFFFNGTGDVPPEAVVHGGLSTSLFHGFNFDFEQWSSHLPESTDLTHLFSSIHLPQTISPPHTMDSPPFRRDSMISPPLNGGLEALLGMTGRQSIPTNLPLVLSDSSYAGSVSTVPTSAIPAIDVPTTDSDIVAEFGLQSYSESSRLQNPETGDDEAQDLALELSKLSLNSTNRMEQIMIEIVPEEELRFDLLSIFFEHIETFGPSLHAGQFYHDLKLKQVSPLLINAMYAVACTFNRTDIGRQGGINPEGEFYFGRVRRLLASCLEDGPTLAIVFTALCMATYCVGTGRPSSGWMYGGLASRMLTDMGWHKSPVKSALKSLTLLEREIRVRTWWSVIWVDTTSSAMASREVFVKMDDQIMLDYPDDNVWNSIDEFGQPLPGSHAERTLRRLVIEGRISPRTRTAQGIYSGVSSPGSNTNGSEARQTLEQLYGPNVVHIVPSVGFYEQATLYQIFSKIIQLVKDHGPQRFQHPDFFVLSMQLSDWLAMLPAPFAEPVAPTVTTQGHALLRNTEIGRFMVSAYLHMLYNTCVILLYRPEMNFETFSWPSEEVWQQCTKAADKIADISQKTLEIDPNFEFQHFFVAFILFESGMIHVANCLQTPPAAADPVVVRIIQNRSRSNVAFLLIALTRLTRSLMIAERYHTTLKELAERAGIDTSF